LWEWWDKKIKQSSEKTKNLLNSSRQGLIDPVMKTGSGRKKVSAYYIKFSQARERSFEVKEIVFKPEADQNKRKEYINKGYFFEKAFAQRPEYNLDTPQSDTELNQKLTILLHGLKQHILKNDHHIEKKQKNWLFYLSKRRDLSQKHTVTFCPEFCAQNGIDCPFIGLV
jgi:hypothetical protein